MKLNILTMLQGSFAQLATRIGTIKQIYLNYFHSLFSIFVIVLILLQNITMVFSHVYHDKHRWFITLLVHVL